MNVAVFVVAAYGFFSLIGGIIGYAKAKSTASLIAGSLSGFFLVASAYGIARDVGAAYFVALIIALLLGARFFKTWFRTRRLMPDLLMIIFSSATLVVVGLQLMKR